MKPVTGLTNEALTTLKLTASLIARFFASVTTNVLIATGALMAPVAGTAAPAAADYQRLQRQIDEIRVEHNVPGAGLVIVDHDTRWIHRFGGGQADGRGDQKELLGGKGANLAEMTCIGIPVPPGFTISTECCAEVLTRGGKWPDDLWNEVTVGIASIEQHTGRRFGDTDNPLLVSVRSGAKFSMPGMMDTILNLGLNDESVEGLKDRTSNGRFAFDSFRFIPPRSNRLLWQGQ